ncbi:MAG TPA: Crp/Fnr family transcriptional regulator [Terriglobales bacterium]|jgi:CRP/FNR family transcriptional regulator|nr:Crp/Fnr family transcriptional regulator [Terriglobales bacterium]
MKSRTPYGMEIADDCATCPMRKDGFFCQMKPETLADFQKIKFTSLYPAAAVLFVEGQVPRGVYMLCKGRVKLTMASPSGKTVIVRVVEAGELLGLHSVISGDAHEVTAETLQPCQVDFIRSDDFKKLLHDHGDASLRAMQQFSNYYRGACHQIRYLGLTPSATEKMACFLLESAAHGQETPKGVRFNLSLTHEEIAQVVGVTRETVTRSLTELRNKMLISTKGPSVLIKNRSALEAMVVA